MGQLKAVRPACANVTSDCVIANDITNAQRMRRCVFTTHIFQDFLQPLCRAAGSVFLGGVMGFYNLNFPGIAHNLRCLLCQPKQGIYARAKVCRPYDRNCVRHIRESTFFSSSL